MLFVPKSFVIIHSDSMIFFSVVVMAKIKWLLTGKHESYTITKQHTYFVWFGRFRIMQNRYLLFGLSKQNKKSVKIQYCHSCYEQAINVDRSIIGFNHNHHEGILHTVQIHKCEKHRKKTAILSLCLGVWFFAAYSLITKHTQWWLSSSSLNNIINLHLLPYTHKTNPKKIVSQVTFSWGERRNNINIHFQQTNKNYQNVGNWLTKKKFSLLFLWMFCLFVLLAKNIYRQCIYCVLSNMTWQGKIIVYHRRIIIIIIVNVDRHWTHGLYYINKWSSSSLFSWVFIFSIRSNFFIHSFHPRLYWRYCQATVGYP
mgnify:CR=1 FL=1